MSITYLLIICAIIVIVWLLMDWLKVPEPLNKIIKVVLVFAVVIVLINFLFTLGGGTGGSIRLR